MKALNCPYCGQTAASIWDLSNAYYMFSAKKCTSCRKRIKVNPSFLIHYYLGALLSFLFIICIWFFTESFFKGFRPILYFAFFVLAMVANYMIPYVLGNAFNRRLFLRIENDCERSTDG
jgi:glucan phosphoethanolaminetransferase (alkaline phosphatase superfamily)